MSAPFKPWEQARTLNTSMNNLGTQQNVIVTPAGRYRTTNPALPPRPASTLNGSSTYGGYNANSYRPYQQFSSPGYGYGNYGYGSGMYGYGSGMYGGSGYGGYPNGLGAESRFIQLAEESTRPAFQNIESVVRTFSSISMMLDSTFFAVTSSFRAVLGVADSFGRIRTMFSQLWSGFALFRALNWICKKLLRLLGLKVGNSDAGAEAWSQAVKETVVDGSGSNSASWPIFLFLGMIISAPYLISKMLPPIIDKGDPKNWPSPGVPARVSYEFQATNPQEITIRPGDKIIIAPKSVQKQMELANSGWAFAVSGQNSGIVPLNYVQPIVMGATNRSTVTEVPVPEDTQTEQQLERSTSDIKEVEIKEQ